MSFGDGWNSFLTYRLLPQHSHSVLQTGSCIVPLLPSLPELRGAGLPELARGVLSSPFVPCPRYHVPRPQKHLSPVEMLRKLDTEEVCIARGASVLMDTGATLMGAALNLVLTPRTPGSLFTAFPDQGSLQIPTFAHPGVFNGKQKSFLREVFSDGNCTMFSAAGPISHCQR